MKFQYHEELVQGLIVRTITTPCSAMPLEESIVLHEIKQIARFLLNSLNYTPKLLTMKLYHSAAVQKMHAPHDYYNMVATCVLYSNVLIAE